ncbi:MAG: polysaccharide biosynthesis/export family protein [Chthoniobacterales bacterium]|nr:polysaccharide biosynthesis/export family protein [Chthoniobacterales bacterium]
MTPNRRACFSARPFAVAPLVFLLVCPLHAQVGPMIPPVARPAEVATPIGTPPPLLPQQPSESSGTAAASTTVSMDVLDNSRELARGDVLNFRIVEDGDPPVSLRINDSGDIEIPYVGGTRAQGKSPRTLAFEIKSMLERDYYHDATVIISIDVEGQKSAGLFYMSGAVRGAGPQQIPFNEKFTVSKAILRAGGFADFANERKVKLTRALPDGQTETKFINVKEIIEKGRLDLDVEIQPNDFITVPERLINF